MLIYIHTYIHTYTQEKKTKLYFDKTKLYFDKAKLYFDKVKFMHLNKSLQDKKYSKF